ncbi:hypothetical protein MALU111345_15290 [Marinicrinis lubricantis]
METMFVLTVVMLLIISVVCFKCRGKDDRKWMKLILSLVLSVFIPLVLTSSMHYFISEGILQGALFTWTMVGFTVIGFIIFQLLLYDIRTSS